jgi:tripartite motif-containing protein 71
MEGAFAGMMMKRPTPGSVWCPQLIGLLAVLSLHSTHGQVNTSFVRLWGGSGSGNGQFKYTHAVAWSPLMRIYVSDEANHRIQYFTMNGAYLGQWGQYGTGTADINNPVCTAFRANGNVYVVERDNHRIHYFTPDGAHLGMWGSQGGGTGQFERPSAAAFGPDGTLYVADRDNHRIQHFTPDGTFLGMFGVNGSADGQLNQPMGIAVSSDSVVYVSDSQNRRVEYYSTNGVFLGKWGLAGSDNGQFGSPSAYNTGPVAISLDRRGYIYVADPDNSRIELFTATGQFLGTFGYWGSSNGHFYFSNGVACAPGWQVYVGDELNNQIQQMTVTIGSDTKANITYSGLAGGNWTMQVDALPDRSYTVKRSTNMADWVAVTNLNIPAGAFTVTDPVPAGTPRGFYRVEQP